MYALPRRCAWIARATSSGVSPSSVIWSRSVRTACSEPSSRRRSRASTAESRSLRNWASVGSSSTNSAVYDATGWVSWTRPSDVMFHEPPGKGLPIAPGGRATWGTPMPFAVTVIRSTRRGTSGPATGPGIRPSTGTNV